MKIRIELEDGEIEFLEALKLVAGTTAPVLNVKDGVVEFEKPLREVMGGGASATSLIKSVECHVAE